MASFDYNNNNKKPFVRQPGFHPNDPPDEVLRGASEVGESGSQGGSSESRGGDDKGKGGQVRRPGGQFVRQPGFHPNDPPDKVLRGASEVGEGGSQGGCSESRGGDDGEIRVEGGIGETTAILEFWRPWSQNSPSSSRGSCNERYIFEPYQIIKGQMFL